MAKTLQRLFKPRNVAIVNASEKISYFIYGFIEQGYDMEDLYLINPKIDEIIGQKCFKNIIDVPAENIDLVILAVRRDFLIDTMKDILSKKKIRFIHVFTAGTGESDEKGEKIEQDIKSILTSINYKTRVLGPNCMGIYSTPGNIAYYPSFPREKGMIGMVFQSGDLHTKFIKIGAYRHGLTFSSGASVGNCIDLQVSEFLEYFNNDKETKLVCVYFEGLSKLNPNEGKKLLKALKFMKKPVLLMKGGKTPRSRKAIITHTGSIASDKRIWDAIFNQTPTINVPSSLDDMIDHAYLFSKVLEKKKTPDFPRDKNVLVILWSGGFGILATDMITDLGLKMPFFEGETLEKLQKIYPLTIGSLNNPLDLPWMVFKREYLDIARTAISDEIDLVIIETDAWRDMKDGRFEKFFNNLTQIKNHVESLNKLLIITLPEYPSEKRAYFYDLLIKEDFIVFPNVQRAAKAFLALYNYGRKSRRMF